MYVLYALLYSLFLMSYRTEEEKSLLVTAYRAILALILKLKTYLPIQEDADTEYFYKVVTEVCNVHMPQNALMYVMQMQKGCDMACSEVIRWINQSMIMYLAAGPNSVRIDSHIKDKLL